jgi:hypothetical protein
LVCLVCTLLGELVRRVLAINLMRTEGLARELLPLEARLLLVHSRRLKVRLLLGSIVHTGAYS